MIICLCIKLFQFSFLFKLKKKKQLNIFVVDDPNLILLIIWPISLCAEKYILLGFSLFDFNHPT